MYITWIHLYARIPITQMLYYYSVMYVSRADMNPEGLEDGRLC